MKKIIYSLFMFVFITCVYAACSQHEAPKVASVPVTPPPVPEKTTSNEVMVVSEDNWEFTLPSKDWHTVDNLPASITRGLFNKKALNLILFVKEPFSGTFEQYALYVLYDVKESGATLTSAQTTVINGQKFILLSVLGSTGANESFMWITFSTGYGYLLTCTSPVIKQASTLCSNIAETIKL